MRNPPDAADTFTNDRHVGDRCVTLLVLLWPIMLIALIGAFRSATEEAPIQPALGTVNPNTAPWSELTILPRIGEIMAHRIVEYRESVIRPGSAADAVRAFSCVADLDNVRGIGPVTLQRLGPLLHFDDP
jgi:DNA uptake protein ComE-like DNA-binding protein